MNRYYEAIREAEKEVIREAMRLHKGNQVKAAKYLGISRGKLRHRLGLSSSYSPKPTKKVQPI